MLDFLADILNWLEMLPPFWAYVLLFIIAYGENVLPPVPGDMVIVFAGYLAGAGALNFAVAVGLSILGGVLGFMTMYLLGYRIGETLIDTGRLKWLPREQVRRARQWIERWGQGVVALNRFLPGARSVIALTVGIAEMDGAKTAIWATFSATAWTALIAWAGYEVGDNWILVSRWLKAYGQGVVLLLVTGALAVVVRRIWKAHRGNEA